MDLREKTRNGFEIIRRIPNIFKRNLMLKRAVAYVDVRGEYIFVIIHNLKTKIYRTYSYDVFYLF